MRPAFEGQSAAFPRQFIGIKLLRPDRALTRYLDIFTHANPSPSEHFCAYLVNVNTFERRSRW
jgi:hypothetical protein